jgi:hypothetical protein
MSRFFAQRRIDLHLIRDNARINGSAAEFSRRLGWTLVSDKTKVRCRGLLLCCAYWLAAVQAVASPAAQDTFEIAALQSDAAVLERAFRELHPGLFRYLTPTELDQSFRDLRQEWTRDRTLTAVFLALAQFAGRVHCGHTYANFFNQSQSVQQTLFEQTPRLPFYFRWIDRKIIVTRDFTNQGQLPIGTEVIRINGTSAKKILARLLPLSRADGSNDAKRIDQLNVTGDSIYESFDVYYPLVFGLKAGTVRLMVRTPRTQVIHSIQVGTLTYAQRIAPITAHEQGRRDGTEPLFDWRELPGGAAVLRMPTWAMFNSQWDWQTWLNQHLDGLATRHTPALIVDLRGNEGGNDVGDEILRRLVAADLPLSGMKRLVRYRSAPADLLPYLDTWDPSFKNWGDQAIALEHPWPTAPLTQYFALAGDDNNLDARAVIRPLQPHFGGRVFVLIDAANSSATFQFAQVVQQLHLGTLVGEPTGGNRQGINGGAFFFLRLPHSGIEIDLPLIGTFPKEPQPDAGLVPDVVVAVSAADIAAGRDVGLTAVENLLVPRR